MKLQKADNDFYVETENYKIEYNSEKPLYVNVTFKSSIGAEFFVASGCDRDDGIDELITLDYPKITEYPSKIEVLFTGKTTLWDKAEYTFNCFPEKITYSYEVYGNGNLEIARFFEGFLKDDPRRKDKFYPYFCGPGRHLSYHRPVKEFMRSSTPKFDLVYSFTINSSDTRCFMYYEDAKIRVNGDRHYFGGDWLATPPPFLYLAGNRDKKHWVTLGLAVKAGEAAFNGYHYLGGEGFGLVLDYDGYTRIQGKWESPQIVMFENKEDVYEALRKYVVHLQENGCMKKIDRSTIPLWWKKPIFGGWGEQVYHSNRWDNFYSGEHDDWSHDNVERLCTQEAYEKMLADLEQKGIDPTILIVDNRWFRKDALLDVDESLWPDLKGFIINQHSKGRKVILWTSPWSYCKSSSGKDVPLNQHMIVDEDGLYTLEIDTDVFYDACNLEHKKVRKYYRLPEPTLTEPHWRFVADPMNPDYSKRVQEKIHYLISPEGLDADGFEFDYTHFLPTHRGIRPIQPRNEMIWGLESLHAIIKIYYDQARKSKPDALIISHTFNPYFNDVVDMLRLQDIYTDYQSIVPQMEHRARIAQKVCPGCVIHTDQHPMPSLEAWREYARFQPKIGNPCLYYVTGIETTREKFTEDDYKMLKTIWDDYNHKLKKNPNLYSFDIPDKL